MYCYVAENLDTNATRLSPTVIQNDDCLLKEKQVLKNQSEIRHTSNATDTLWAQVVPDEVEVIQDLRLVVPFFEENSHLQCLEYQ